MERNGFHTPKKSRFNPKKSNLNINNNSPIHSILRRQSFIPPKTIQSFNNKHHFQTRSKGGEIFQEKLYLKKKKI